MTVALAQTIFSAGPRDNLAAADVYARSTGSVINSIQALAKSSNLDFATVLRGGSGLLNLLPMITGVSSAGGLLVNKENLIARMAGSTGISAAVTAIKSAGGSLVSAITDNVPGASEVFASIDGITQKVLSSDLVDLGAISKTIMAVTNNSSVYAIADRSAATGLFSGLLTESMRYGIPNSFTALQGAITGSGVLNRVIGQTLPYVVKSSDLKNLRAMAQAVSPGQLSRQYPNLVQDFSSNYTRPVGATAAQNSQAYEDVIAAFSKASPGWSSGSRSTSAGTASVINLTNLVGCSKDMQSVLVDGVASESYSSNLATTIDGVTVPPAADRKYFTLASLFKTTTVDAQLSKFFPQTVLGPTERTTSAVVDPRTYAG